MITPDMYEDGTPRELPERTGRHVCVRCLAEVTSEVYLRNDHICEACTEREEYPLASTPEPRDPRSRSGDDR
jgi:hypothetical protein